MKFGLIISKQHPPGVSMVERFREHIEQVRAARDAGFDLIVMGQHYLSAPFQEIQTLPSLARLAAEAGTMRVGATVLLLPLLNPVDVAEQVATLDVICEGRFIFGAGLGYREEEYEAFGVQGKERVPRFVESLEVIKRLWTEDEVTHHGRFYDFEDVTIEPKPRKGSLDIWIGGRSDAILKRVVRLGDGWFPALTSPDEFKRDMGKIAAFGDQYGRTVSPREAGVLLFSYVSEDRDAAQRAIAPFLRALPMPPEQAAARCVVGSPAECVEKLNRFVEAGCVKFVLRPSCPPADVMAQIETYGKDILPHFN